MLSEKVEIRTQDGRRGWANSRAHMARRVGDQVSLDNLDISKSDHVDIVVHSAAAPGPVTIWSGLGGQLSDYVAVYGG